MELAINEAIRIRSLSGMKMLACVLAELTIFLTLAFIVKVATGISVRVILTLNHSMESIFQSLFKSFLVIESR
jgi:hypothetical protein